MIWLDRSRRSVGKAAGDAAVAVAEAEAVVEVADDRNPQGEFQTSLRIPCPDRLSAGEQGFSHTEIDQKDDCKKSSIMFVRVVALLASLLVVDAQIFGGGGARANLDKMSEEERNHMEGTPQGAAAVDRAMQEWDSLANNPEMMSEMMESFKDPEVIAKAKEMINDPEYMKAAKKKLADMQKKAAEAGLLDANGKPVPGAATAAGKAMPAAASMMAQMQQAMAANGRVQ